MIATAKVIQANPFIPTVPTLKQLRFLARPEREVFFGGSAGPGKSEGLLMAALMYVELPDYAAILFRRTFADLALEGALMDRARDWLHGTAAKWRANEKRWEFPSGSTLTFGYMDGPNDWRRYDSAEFQAVLFDEASQFRPHDINAMQGRLRRPTGSHIPIRLRLGSNPGGEAHDFLGDRYVHPEEDNPERAFVPALFEDNPYLDIEEYGKTLESLKDIDPILYRQRRYGEWILDEADTIFQGKWWGAKERPRVRYDIDDNAVRNRVFERYLFFDTPFKDKESSSYAACVVLEVMAGSYRVNLRHATREKLQVPDLEPWITQLAHEWNHDGLLANVVIEDRASGIGLVQTFERVVGDEVADLIVGFAPPGSKDEKCRQAAIYCRLGLVPIPYPSENAGWLSMFMKELLKVPNSDYRDLSDAFALGCLYLERYLGEARIGLERETIEA